MNRYRPDNPFPGLRPFEQHESSLFFGRDEQCDDLLSRLARRRLVAVVGTSGSGKSSLVRAGLLPALDRGYVPSAGSSWHVAVFRPGSAPLANLTRALVERRRPGSGGAAANGDAIRTHLESSSHGLISAARTLLTDSADSLLVVADQFEEIFRFARLRAGHALDEAAACVDLLVNAAAQDGVPIYVVITMRSDYLGDCAQFTGLPEALNDSQFLVPRMTRAQLRAAIENPVAVCGASITPRLVQRLLHDVDQLAVESGRTADYDQLPLLQHALMRVWQVSRPDRDRSEPIDLHHYEQHPVETLTHALDHHAEEVFTALPSDRHRDVARRIFQQLTDRDPENREVRRPTPLPELTAVALCLSPADATAADDRVVNDVVAAFSAEDCAFLVTNAQRDVDISHESFIRKWDRLRYWVEHESRSRRIYTKLVDAAVNSERHAASLFRGPELAETRRWWREENPTQLWANRYDHRFDSAQKFLTRSIRAERLRRTMLFGNVAILILAALAIGVLTVISNREARRAEVEARRAEDEALNARNAIEESRIKLAQANTLYEQAIQAVKLGQDSLANVLTQRAQTSQQQANTQVLTPGELAELQRLRKEESTWKSNADAVQQLTAARQQNAQLQSQITDLNGRITALERTESTLRDSIRDMRAQLAEFGMIAQVLRDYRVAYESLDASAVAKVQPSVDARQLSNSFAQLRSYRMEITGTRVNLYGNTAEVSAFRRVSAQPKVGSPLAPEVIATTFSLRRTEGGWIIASVR